MKRGEVRLLLVKGIVERRARIALPLCGQRILLFLDVLRCLIELLFL